MNLRVCIWCFIFSLSDTLVIVGTTHSHLKNAFRLLSLNIPNMWHYTISFFFNLLLLLLLYLMCHQQDIPLQLFLVSRKAGEDINECFLLAFVTKKSCIHSVSVIFINLRIFENLLQKQNSFFIANQKNISNHIQTLKKERKMPRKYWPNKNINYLIMLTSFKPKICMSYYRSICGLITIKSNNDHEYVDIIMLTWHITPLLLCYSMVSTSRKRILEEAAVVLKDQVSSMLLKQTNESAVEDLYFGLILIILMY